MPRLCHTKVELCEIAAVLCVAILPTVLVAVIVYHYGQPLDNGIMSVALMIFAAVIVLWIVTRICRSRTDASQDRVGLVSDPEALVEEVITKSPGVNNQTPIFTPLTSNLLQHHINPKTAAPCDIPPFLVNAKTPADFNANNCLHV